MLAGWVWRDMSGHAHRIAVRHGRKSRDAFIKEQMDAGISEEAGERAIEHRQRDRAIAEAR